MRVDLLHPSTPKATAGPWRQVVSWWSLSGARHRRTQAVASSLLIASLLVSQAQPASAAPCSFTEDGNGDVIIAASCEIAAGTYNITRDFIINAGVTVTAQGNTGAGTGVVINAGRHITISSTAVFTATGQGYAGEAGPGAGVSGSGASGGSHGGNGGRGSGVTTQGATHGSLTGPVSLGSGGGESTNYGGVQAAAGGGAIKLSATSGTVTVSGTVSANGNTAGNFDAGGGAGGSVWIEAGTLAGTGTITANGGSGTGGSSIGGGGGGGGRIAITGYASGTPTSYAVTAQGGSKASTSAAQAGGAGTIFFKSSSATNGDLIVDNNDQSTIGDTSLTTQGAATNLTFDAITVRDNSEYVIPSGSTMTLATGGAFTGGGTSNGMVRIASGGTFDPGSATYTFAGPDVVHSGTIATVTAASVSGSVFYEDASTGTWSATLSSFTVLSTGTLSTHSTSAFVVPTLTVNSGGTLTHTDNGTTHLYSLSISATTIDLQTGSIVNVQGRGFDANSGTGAGGSSVDGGGGAHGGDGADPPCCANGGLAYGSVTQPVTLGSGGGNTGGAGGGAVKLVASGTLTVNTTINANGVEPTSGTAAGGAGGSIWLDAGTLAGTGILSADGENGNTWGGPGAGGRVAVYYNTDTSTLLSTGTSTHAYGAVAESWGTSGSSASGTVFVDDKDDALANGSLIIDNNNIDAVRSDTPQLTASQTYDNITLRKGAEYRIGSGETLTLGSGGTLTTGGTTPLGQLIIDSGGTFTLPSTLSTTISGLNVTNNGTFNPPGATMTISGGAFVNAGTFNTVTNLTAAGGVNFTHSGNFPATVTALTVSGASTYLHSGTGMSITNGANFVLSGSSTFTHNSATGFATGLDMVIGAGTFVAQHTSFNNQNSLTVQAGGTFQQNHTSTLTITTVTVNTGGALNHGDNTTSHLYSLNISATTIDLQAGALVNVQGRGFDANSGTGAGGSGVDGGGGAHGADGSDPPCCTNGGLAYGSVTAPVTIGSGGGNTGGAGGGAIKLVATGTLTVNTAINAKGNPGLSGTAAGGAGGSIWLDAGTLAGTGSLSADGENGSTWGGSGGGGRIAVYYNTDTSTLISSGTSIHAYGDYATSWGTYGSSSAGTVFIDDKDDSLPNGDLILDNNNIGSGARSDTPQLSASQTYDNITIRKGAAYRIGSGETLALASGGAFTTGGTAFGTVITDVGGTFTLPATLSSTFSSLNMTNNGSFNPPSATVTWSGGTVANGGSFNTVTNLTATGGVNFTHSGTYPATLSSLTVTGASTYLHTGTGMSITSGANFVLSGSSTFTYSSSTGFATGLDMVISSGTFVAQHASFTNQNSLTVQGGGIFEQKNMSAIAIGTLTVQSGGSLTHTDNTTSHLYSVNISATTIDLQTGSIVNVQGRGFDAGSGTGAGGSGVDGGGGAHGADGSDPPCCTNGGLAYGSVTAPVTLGSGGGNTGGAGGGAVKLVATGTLTVNTTVNAKGNTGASGTAAGGAGGSIWLDAGTLAGTGALSADGENGSTWGGSGAGGRVAVYYNNDTSTLISSGTSIHAYGDYSSSWGTYGSSSAGTVFVDDKDDALPNGNLIIDNNNIDTGARSDTPQLTASQTYDNITIKNGAAYRIGSGETLTLASGGAFTNGGTAKPELLIDSGGTFDPNKTTMSISGLDVTLSGTFTDVTSLTYASGTFRNNTVVAAGLSSLTVGSGANWIQTSTTNPFSGSGLVVQSGGTFTQDNTSVITVTNVTVESGGIITHDDNTTTRTAYVNISATTFNVQSGGLVTANNLGYDSSEGTGQPSADSATAGGAGYCGAGGNGSTPGTGGSSYGSVTNPDDLGSGGGDDTNIGGLQGGSGGGQIKIIVSGTLTVAGTISANGQSGTANEGGGGSGGTINLTASTWAGGGTISANGGGGSPTTSSTVGGGGGSGGRVRVNYASKTFSGTLTSTGGNKGGFGGSSAATAGATCTPSEFQTDVPPTVTSVTHSPSAPTTTMSVTLSGTATDDTGITQIQIYLDGTAPANLKHTCTFSPAETPASCSINVGTLSVGAHTTTIRASDGSSTTDGTENFSVTTAAPTLSNAITMSRLKTSAASSVSIAFTLQNTLSGTLTVTFPVGFTVTAAANGGASSACLSGFGFTSSTLTATKTNCSGTVTIGGATVTNPAAPGLYYISWVNDDPGGGSVVITDSDQVEVSFAVDPLIAFNVGSQTAACDGTFSGSGGSLGLGALTTGTVASSDVSSVPHVCARLSTNAAAGAAVTVRSVNGALVSAGVPADQIASATATLVAGTAGYGMCVGSSGGDVGRDATTPTGAMPSAAAPFNGSCTTSAHSVGALTTSPQSLWVLSGPSQNAFARIFLKASVSPATPAHADYQDTLTFIATGTY